MCSMNIILLNSNRILYFIQIRYDNSIRKIYLNYVLCFQVSRYFWTKKMM